jgi:hypothetical protein
MDGLSDEKLAYVTNYRNMTMDLFAKSVKRLLDGYETRKERLQIPTSILLDCLREVQEKKPACLDLIRIATNYKDGFFEIGIYPILNYEPDMIHASEFLKRQPNN